jgi:hypothetical protein
MFTDFLQKVLSSSDGYGRVIAAIKPLIHTMSVFSFWFSSVQSCMINVPFEEEKSVGCILIYLVMIVACESCDSGS